MDNNCGNCKFYLKTMPQGECHIRAPNLHIVVTPQGALNVAGWPPTKQTNWCGEHVRKVA